MQIPFNIFDTLPRDCWVDIDASQLADNIRILQAHAGCPALAVIKANGYGHGYQNAARAFLVGGASYLGVASLSEGMLLRQMGITAPVLIICGMLPAEMATAAQAGLEFFVWRSDHVTALREMPKGRKPIRVHLEIDTGMGRGGCWPEEAVQIAQELRQIEGIELAGLCTHFASADILDIDDTPRQIDRFNQAIAALAAVGIRPEIIHAANSPGSLYFPQARYDMVRLGVVAYGVPPDEGLAIPDGVKTALTWRARITSTKILPADHGVGYGSEYTMPSSSRIGVLPVGYADGFRRVPKNINTVLIEGQERKVLGRVCMDQCMIDLSGLGDITGAEAILIGRQGDRQISVEDVARRWNTNPYDVYTGIATRVPRHAAGA
ncbi:MAG: alanine racemase [Alphaproteobacteria bacterium]